jgi:hypothetical protein
MAMIYVRTKPGRKAFFQGKVLPQDKFVPVPDTPYIRRLVSHWGDLEVEGGYDPKAKAASTKEKEPWHPVGGKVTPSTPPAPGTGAPTPKPA